MLPSRSCIRTKAVGMNPAIIDQLTYTHNY